jgi:UDP-glucose 4-epimerase
MKVLVTGSSGHLGEALVGTLKDLGCQVAGLDILESAFTTHAGSICDRSWVRHCLRGVQQVFHTATLHKPHVATHRRQDFIDTNLTGTLNLLEEASAVRVQSSIYTSTTSVFGHALVPPPGAPAAWITEEVTPAAKNIYGVTKAAAEDLCELFHHNQDTNPDHNRITTKITTGACSGRRVSSPKRMTTGRCGRSIQTRMRRRMSTSTGGLTSKTW